MLAWEMRSWSEAQALPDPVFFDRGVPDCIGYLNLCGVPVPDHFHRAADYFRYSASVFVLPPWLEIYGNDSERKQDFAEAQRTYDCVSEVYLECGYKLMEVPRASISDRLAFIKAKY